jgi:hypothetical protein
LKKGKLHFLLGSAFLTCFLLWSITAYTQEDKGTTIIFDDSNSGSYSSPAYSFTRNVFKFDFLPILSGDYTLFYERTFNSKIAAEVGLGVTGKNFMATLGKDLEIGYLAQVVNESSINYDLGHSAKLGLRFYLAGYAPEEFYIQLQYAFRKYNYRYIYDDPTQINLPGPSDSEYATSTTFNELRILFGTCIFSSDNIVTDFFAGIGPKFRSREKLTLEDIENTNGSSFRQRLVSEKATDTVFGFYLGWKIGYAF